MVWRDGPTNATVQEERAAAWTVLSNVNKMGTPALWCFQCPSNCMTVEQSGNDASSHLSSSVEERNYEGNVSLLTPRKRVLLGPDYQAELPDTFCGDNKREYRSVCEVDSLRWLGERVWTKQDLKVCTSRATIQECYCDIQDTLDCVRLHVKEKREALKAEVGEAFFMWGFDEMGEVVAEKWSDEEQSMFQEVVRKNPKSFWHALFESFPAKGTSDLISYYFNVFVLRRRAVQNRIAPDHIDSDDDEMVLDSDERDSDSMLESNEEERFQSGYDAASEDEEENGSMSWPVKDGFMYDKLEGNAGLGKRL